VREGGWRAGPVEQGGKFREGGNRVGEEAGRVEGMGKGRWGKKGSVWMGREEITRQMVWVKNARSLVKTSHKPGHLTNRKSHFGEKGRY